MNFLLEIIRQFFNTLKRPPAAPMQPQSIEPIVISEPIAPPDPVIPTNPPVVDPPKEASSNQFLVLPLLLKDSSGVSLTPYNAKIAAVLDHAGTSIDPVANNVGWGLRAKDRKVKAFNGEIGDGDATTSPPYGFTKTI